MTVGSIKAACLGMTMLVGCSASPVPAVAPVVAPQAPAREGEFEIVPIAHVAPEQWQQWRFDPDSDRLASSEYGRCLVWDILSGTLVLDFGSAIEHTPCTEWGPLQSIDALARKAAADGRLAREVMTSADAATWSPDDRQLLVVRASRAEIWDAATATLVSTLETDLPQNVLITPLWLARGPLLVVWPRYDSARIWTWTANGRRIVTKLPAVSDAELWLDPHARWALNSEFLAWSLHSLGGEQSALQSKWDRAPTPRTTYRGSWSSSGGVTQWTSTVTREDGDQLMGSWEALTLDDAPELHAGPVHESHTWMTLTLRFAPALGGRDPIVWGQHSCEDGSATFGPTPPPGCTFVDLGPGGASSLLQCGARVRLDRGDDSIELPVTGTDLKWAWGRSGWFAVSGGGRLLILPAGADEPAIEREHVRDWTDAKLGLELDRLLIRTKSRVELLELGGKTAQRVESFELRRTSFVDAALSPDLELLALLDEHGLVRVFAPPSRDPIAEWTIPDGDVRLAFRADAAVLFTGDWLPRNAFNPSSGQALDVLAPVAHAIEGQLYESDPSWRWIMLPYAREVVRTLDGARLALEGGYMPDTGRYRDQPPDELRIRLDAADEIELFAVEALEPWLHEPALFERFFANDPLPRVRLSTDEREQLSLAI
jgi:hypothetical protein